VFHRESTRDSEKAKELPRRSLMMAVTGVVFYLRDHLEDFLSERQNSKVRVVVPARLDHFGFRLIRLRSPASEDQEVLKFKIQIQNIFFRMFVPRIEATYDVRKKRILTYHGPTNFADPRGKLQVVTVHFHYPK
jgi:hypothetical protein